MKNEALHLTPDMLEGAYELLRLTPPFRGWKLPEPDDIEFVVNGARDRYAGFRGKLLPAGSNEIQVSSYFVKTLPDLIRRMAHEMIHLRRHIQGERYECPVLQHGKVFKRLAAQVCRHHGFDQELF